MTLRTNVTVHQLTLLSRRAKYVEYVGFPKAAQAEHCSWTTLNNLGR